MCFYLSKNDRKVRKEEEKKRNLDLYEIIYLKFVSLVLNSDANFE